MQRRGPALGCAVLALVLGPGAAPPVLASDGAAALAAIAGSPRMQRVAQFGSVHASEDARRVADWALASGDNGGRAVIVVDKKNAHLFMFDRTGRMVGNTPVLLGAKKGDDTVPGVGDKPISQVRPDERTTPAGRFVAELGTEPDGEDVVWVDYDAAVSLHRVYTGTPSEHRLRRLATPTIADNRISYGCINLPTRFYEDVLSPTVRMTGAVIYVLPEEHPLQQVFDMGPQSPAATLAVSMKTSQ